jgi:lipopolysaccharide/colanic/teichoic acid biosynthesis glycosyltransferase
MGKKHGGHKRKMDIILSTIGYIIFAVVLIYVLIKSHSDWNY